MYRKVTMIEVKEALRLRGDGPPKKRSAAQLGLDQELFDAVCKRPVTTNVYRKYPIPWP